eukprot:CAMPEP_0177788968 /NCGR_PEP_ID=MMETSP0491_2-20121128/22451_1 /TAXON_ID=63592 /ORGANISM="Tetraselmis chuii, Strain PLY429" /LENGTH=478 /DNA_ID=CAMNT_0019310705 /DNA_START=155 /DNA_END=1591 /DNA_ORIENTATION=+
MATALLMLFLPHPLHSKDLKELEVPRTYDELRSAVEEALMSDPPSGRPDPYLLRKGPGAVMRKKTLGVAFLDDGDTEAGELRNIKVPEFFYKYLKLYAAEGDRRNVVPRPDVAAEATVIRPELPGSQAIVAQHLIVREDKRATRMQHAPTIVEVAPGEMLAAWFGGRWEGENDAGIWLSRFQNGEWSEEAWQVVAPVGGVPCWNPVLLHDPLANETVLFFKIGADPVNWHPFLMRSTDKGVTWSARQPIPRPFLGPAKNKLLVLPDGTWLAGGSNEADESLWTAHVEYSRDRGETWHRTADIDFPLSIIQPTIIAVGGSLKMLLRSAHGWTVETDSVDGGMTWSAGKNTSVKNPNSGIDAVTLRDGRILLIHNPTRHARSVLTLDVSSDGGASFQRVVALEQGTQKVEVAPECNDPLRPTAPRETDLLEFSYPTIIEAEDGLVHVTYTYSYFGFMKLCSGRENIKHVVIDPARLVPLA